MAELQVISNRTQQVQKTDWVAEASPRTRVTNPCVDVEYQKLMRFAEMFERHQATGRLLAELSQCLSTEPVRSAAVLQHWIAMMRRQHAIGNPVEKLLADLRESSLGQSAPSWRDIA